MTEPDKLPRKPTEDSRPSEPRRPSHARIIEEIDRWANSTGLQPPEPSDAKPA